MKKVFLAALLSVSMLAAQTAGAVQQTGSITFEVDGTLSPVTDYYSFFWTGEDVAEFMLSEEQIPDDAEHIITTSFQNDNHLKHLGKNAFYRCIVDAYANHLSVTLSPDMIWLIICQGFARYVNAHADEMRPKLVSHTDKMDLAIMTDKDLLTEAANWPSLIDDFASQIGKYTKGDIAKTVTSDFTTTGAIERVASQITLMESVKPYFEYIVYYTACGIPTVRLLGTVADWQRVLEKTKQLEQYGLGQWLSTLEPILREFVQAADGHPNRSFWRGIVKRQSIEKLEGGACSDDKPTELDGWLLKLFPDENGQTFDKVEHIKEMPAEYVRVDFKYRVIDSVGSLLSETPMELWAGFVGAQVDTENNMLTPKIGWLVRKAESGDETLNELKKNADMGLRFRVSEVPEMLSQLGRIHSLHLEFVGKVVLPEWMDHMVIDRFTIEGKMTEAEKAAIKKRFPNIMIK